MNRFFITTMIITAVIVGALAFGLQHVQPSFDLTALITSDILMMTLCIISYFLMKPQIGARPQSFVRGVFSATLLKLFVCMIGFGAYIFINRHNIHRPTVFAMMAIYFIFTLVESLLTSRMAKYVK